MRFHISLGVPLVFSTLVFLSLAVVPGKYTLIGSLSANGNQNCAPTISAFEYTFTIISGRISCAFIDGWGNTSIGCGFSSVLPFGSSTLKYELKNYGTCATSISSGNLPSINTCGWDSGSGCN